MREVEVSSNNKEASFCLGQTVPKICDRSISLYPSLWSEDNPTLGCCIPISLLVQDLLGGDLLRISLKDTPFKKMRYHWFNKTPFGLKDFTVLQFGTFYPDFQNPEEKPRELVLSIRGAMERYLELRERFFKTL